MTILEVIIHIARLPYEAAKRQNEDSVVGQTEWDRNSLQFWKWFAWIATGLILGGLFLTWIVWLIISR